MANTTNTQAQVRRQIRTFVLVWTFITLVMGFATFVAIYFTYSPAVEAAGADDSSSVAQNNAGADEPLIVVPSVTPRPTNTPTITPTPEPTQEIAVAQAVDTAEPTTQPEPTAEPTIEPTIPPAESDRYEVGIQVQHSLDFNPDNQDGYYRSVAEDLGLGWIKQQVRWEEMEREPGQVDYAVLDFVMPSAEKFGLKMMLSIVTAPDWARETGVDLSRHGPPANNEDYVNFVTSIVERYPGQVHAIEVWNEMNLDREWTSTQGLSAQNYVSLLRDTYEAVKAIDPGIIIISGALSPTGFDDGVSAIDDFRYTDLLIQAGVLDYADCYGAHHNGINFPPDRRWNEGYNDPTASYRGPYDNPHHSWSFRSTLEGYATRISSAGSDVPLCVTEFGWPVSGDIGGYPEGFGFAADNTLEEQAEWIAQALDLMEEWGFVRLAFLWNFNYGPQAGWAQDNDNVPYSLIGPGFQFRPAYDAVREWQADYQERTGQN